MNDKLNVVPQEILRLRIAARDEARRPPEPYVRKLPVRTRIGVIVGSSLVLWAVIIAGIVVAVRHA